QKLKNLFNYNHFVTNSDLETTLAKDKRQSEFTRNYIKSQNPNITDAQLDAMTAVQRADMANKMRLDQAEGVYSAAALGLVFDPARYHGETASGGKSAGPKDGQAALDNSVQVKETSPRRVGVDKTNNEIVVLDQTRPGIFHGHVRQWSELTSEMQNVLRE